MPVYTKMQRLQAIAQGEPADRPPVSVWHHFLKQETDAQEFVRATVEFQKKYDWDLVKVNPRAVCFTETWGNQYDYATYIGYGPKCIKSVLKSAQDLESIQKKSGNFGPLGEQIAIVAQLRQKLGPEIPIIQTVFSPLAVILNLTGKRLIGRDREAPREESPIVQFMQQNPSGMHHALEAIAETLSAYTDLLFQNGASGLFYTSLGLAREGYLTYEEWEKYSKKYDLMILERAKGYFTVFHTCGIYANPRRFADYPISALHWAESASGNPPISTASDWLKGKAAMGGVNERLFGARAQAEIYKQARYAVLSNRNRPFFLAPECSVSPDAEEEELKALRNAVEWSGLG